MPHRHQNGYGNFGLYYINLLCVCLQTLIHLSSFTFNTADSPESGVGEVALLGFGLRLGLICGGVGAVANVRPRVEPVVRADGDSHEAEGSESPHGGQQRLNPAVTPSHCASY